MNADILSRLTKVICDVLDVQAQDVQVSSDFIEDLGADSLGLVEILLAAEEEFNIDIPDEEAFNLQTVQDAVDYLVNHLPRT